MINIKKIAKDLFNIKEEIPSRSGGKHEISIESLIDRSNYQDQLPDQFENLESYIDHTILKADASQDDIKKICLEAENYQFKSVCVNPANVKFVKSIVNSTIICSVIGFPLGANDTKIKVAETLLATEQGAKEIDMVINVGLLKSQKFDDVFEDIRAVAQTCHENQAILKVIIETCLLTEKEKVIACLLSKKAGADFVKTSTGFNSSGATAKDIKLMRDVVGPKMGVKASGGVRTKEDALKMLKAGANRIGASASISIVEN